MILAIVLAIAGTNHTRGVTRISSTVFMCKTVIVVDLAADRHGKANTAGDIGISGSAVPSTQ